jgi:hypothetical protein
LASGLKLRITTFSDHAPHVGAGQVVDLTGILFHPERAVRKAWLIAGEQSTRVWIGHQRPAVTERYRAKQVPAPDGPGFRVGFSIPEQGADGELPLRFRVRLAGGVTVERGIPALPYTAGTGARPIAMTWPASGPRVAICMATYKPNLAYLAAQVASIRAQSHANWVCIVCDDGSGPESQASVAALLGDDPRFVLVPHEANVGFYRNFERALQLVPEDAEFVALSDQDDTWDEDKLQTLLARFDDPEVQLVYSDMRLVDAEGNLLAGSFWNPERNRNQWHDLTALVMANTVTGGASMARAQLVREKVLPLPAAPRFHDHWLAGVALANGRIAFVEKPLYSYRQHGDATVGNREQVQLPDPPSVPRLLLARLIGERMHARVADHWMRAVAQKDLPEIAEFATALLLRDRQNLTPAARRGLEVLAQSDQGLRPALRLRSLPEETRRWSEHAERRLVSAAVWHRLQVRRRLRPRLR